MPESKPDPLTLYLSYSETAIAKYPFFREVTNTDFVLLQKQRWYRSNRVANLINRKFKENLNFKLLKIDQKLNRIQFIE